MFIVMHCFRDEFGNTRTARWTMRSYKTRRAADAKADSVRGGFVCPMGSNTPVYVGGWQ